MTEQPQSSQQAGRAPAQSAGTQPTPQTGRGAAFFQNAAKISWALPLIMAAASVLVRNASKDAVVVFDMFRVLAALVCFLVAIVALSGVRRFGRKGILIPAIVGLLLNGLILSVAASNFINAYSRARAPRTALIPGFGSSTQVGCPDVVAETMERFIRFIPLDIPAPRAQIPAVIYPASPRTRGRVRAGRVPRDPG